MFLFENTYPCSHDTNDSRKLDHMYGTKKNTYNKEILKMLKQTIKALEAKLNNNKVLLDIKLINSDDTDWRVNRYKKVNTSKYQYRISKY